MVHNKSYNNEFLLEEIEIVNEGILFNTNIYNLNESPVSDFFTMIKEFFLNILSLIKNALVKFMKFFNTHFNRTTLRTKSLLKKVEKNKDEIDSILSKLSGPASYFHIWKATDLENYENLIRYAGKKEFNGKYIEFENELNEKDHYLEIPLTMSLDLKYVIKKSFEQFNKAKVFAKSFKISSDTMKTASETSIKFATNETQEEKIKENQRLVSDLNKLNVLYRTVINNSLKSHTKVLDEIEKYIK